MKLLQVTYAKSLTQQIKGLLGTTKASPMLFITRWGIHTFGMRYAIDVLILDQKKTIVKMKEHLLPNRIFLWNPKYKQVIELPNGFIQKNKLKMGMRIDVRFKI